MENLSDTYHDPSYRFPKIIIGRLTPPLKKRGVITIRQPTLFEWKPKGSNCGSECPAVTPWNVSFYSFQEHGRHRVPTHHTQCFDRDQRGRFRAPLFRDRRPWRRPGDSARNRLEQIGTDWIGSRASRIKMQISRNQDESGWIKQQNTGSSHWLNVFVEVGDTNCYSMIHLFSYVSVVWFCHSFSTCSIGRAVMRVAGVLRPNNLCLDWDLQWKLLERSRSSAEEAAGDLWRGRERDRGARWDGEGIRNYITDAHFGQNKIW